jgi:carboxylesterase type B
MRAAIARASIAATIVASALAQGFEGGTVTVFFYNDGNWTRHAQQPSALFINTPATYEEAVATCALYGETLLSCSSYGDFSYEFTYQQYLHNIGPDQRLWSSCSSSEPSTWEGGVSCEADPAALLPFLCTNTAPFVDKVDTDYAVFPRIKTQSTTGTTFEGMRDHMSFRFLGIPYAQPPVGDLRFKYAQPWKAPYVEATGYGPACLQYQWFDGNAEGLNPWGNSEDCLYLNVYTPFLPLSPVPLQEEELKPVMFWIHGGAQVTGTGSDATFDGSPLVSRSDVVLVTLNYRLNIFGFLALDDGVVTGNYDLSDKILALNWVKENIAAFGGNPNNVTIFGQSAGAASIVDLVNSPKAKGLFQGAIAQSIGGHTTNQSTVAARILPYLEPLCNGTGEERLKCLQAVPAETLRNISANTPWQTVVDGIYIPELPVAQVSKGRDAINPVNFMVGFLPDEAQSLLEYSVAPNATSFNQTLQVLIEASDIVQEQADNIEASGVWNVPTEYSSVYNATVNVATDTIIICYAKEFAEVGAAADSYDSLWVYLHQHAYGLSWYEFYDLCTFPVGEPDTPYYKCHSGDLYEVFGTYYIFDLPLRADADIYYTNAIQDMWASFARTGNPNVDESYLVARGYQSTREFFSGFTWTQYGEAKDGMGVANLQYPTSYYSTLPDLQQCGVLGLNNTE